ncbi:ABC transporter permease subunit [Clostridium perfringens]|uniref:ABC transporter permease n=1 Tax=Clostridium perfringens TaxID=1502 RepID=UPI001D46E58B|nr:ABC transporter permease subunit [Clostridium perfringens]EHK2347907.1 ABC transporter permease subunit [Clostridium perfringens]MCX0374530.1 ABC transporter permease subunit [Clostridium perfringens]
MKKFSYKNKKLIFLSSVILFILWQLASMIIGSEVILPSPYLTFKGLIEVIKSNDFFKIIISTLGRTFISFTLALVIALFLGVFSAFNKYIYNFMVPILNVMRSLPTIGFIILALIWLSQGIAPILVGFVMSFPIFYDAIIGAILNIDKNILEMAKVYEIGMGNLIKNIYLPSISFAICRIMVSTFSLTMKLVVGGEVIGQPKYSIGTALFVEKNYLNTNMVFAWIIVVIIIGIIFSLIQKTIDGRVFRWMK